jgi:hypothetical protein
MLIEFGCTNLKERNHLKDLGADGKVIYSGFEGRGWNNAVWSNVALDREKQQAVVNAVLNLRVHKLWVFLDLLRND